MFYENVKIKEYEVGLVFRDGEFQDLLAAGNHKIFDPWHKTQVRIASTRDPWINEKKLYTIVKSGKLEGHAVVLDLLDYQRALVWIDGRLSRMLGPGLFAYWLGGREVRTEVIDIRNVRFDHLELKAILKLEDAGKWLDVCKVERDAVGVLYIDGKFTSVLEPGLYAFWKDAAEAKVVSQDVREMQIDVSGQEFMTLDKVTLRMNASVTYVVKDAKLAVSAAVDVRQSLYRDVQFGLREVIGQQELDSFLTAKDEVTQGLKKYVVDKAAVLGLEVRSVGIKDVILPGEIRDLMNKVTEAKKAAEANLIARREETAAMRSQANTAKLLAENPTLMRLRELEVLEKVASSGKMNIMLSDKGLTDKVVHLL